MPRNIYNKFTVHLSVKTLQQFVQSYKQEPAPRMHFTKETMGLAFLGSAPCFSANEAPKAKTTAPCPVKHIARIRRLRYETGMKKAHQNIFFKKFLHLSALLLLTGSLSACMSFPYFWESDASTPTVTAPQEQADTEQATEQPAKTTFENNANTPKVKELNPMGVSGKYNKEAEKWYAMAHVLWRNMQCSNPRLAVEYLDKALMLEPQYADALFRRGLALSELQEFDEAFDNMTEAVRLAPSEKTYAWRGLVALRMGNVQGAIQDCTEALRYNSEYSQAWNIRAAARLMQGNIDDACDDFENGCDYGDCTGLESAQREELCQ